MDKNENAFDDIIKDRLGRIRPERPTDAWSRFEAFEGSLGEVEAGPAGINDRDFDEAVFSKLNTFEAGRPAEQWQRMDGLLNQWFTWPQYVLRYKSIELLLFLLLFTSLWPYLPTASQRPALAQLPISENVEGTAAHAASALAKAQLESAAVGHTDTGAPGAAERLSGPALVPSSALPVADGRKALFKVPLPTVQTLTPNLNSAAAAHTLDDVGIAEPEMGPAPLPPFGPIESRQAGVLAYNCFGLPEQEEQQPSGKPVLAVGMFSSAEYNTILVPASEEKRLTENLNRAALGYGGGLSLDLDFGRFEIGSGAIYAARSYPVGVVYVQGSLLSGLRGDELQTTELNMITLPIRARYDVIERGHWRFYAMGGSALHVAFQSNYYTADAPQYSFRPMAPQFTDGNSGQEAQIDRIRRNGLGWFEGGSFSDNAYLTANIGLGAERLIGERWSLFAQPFYQHAFYYLNGQEGIGPNSDQINSLSLFFGTRVRLK